MMINYIVFTYNSYSFSFTSATVKSPFVIILARTPACVNFWNHIFVTLCVAYVSNIYGLAVAIGMAQKQDGGSNQCMCSAQTGNLRKHRIALRKPGIPGLPGKPGIARCSSAPDEGKRFTGNVLVEFIPIQLQQHHRRVQKQLLIPRTLYPKSP